MSSPAIATPDDPRRSVLLQHPRSVVRLIDPVTLESVDAAKAAQRKERAWVIASILAGFDGVNLRTCSSRERVHYLDIGLRSVDDAGKGLAL